MAPEKRTYPYLVPGMILSVAAFLRFWDPFGIPFTYDEFSALFRTEFTSFGELLDNGVKVDGHPALIQVFLWFWTGIFGWNPFWIKLPFILAGLASVWLIFRISRDWFGETSAAFAASFAAVAQYTVMYSQIARPYISGLFFILLMLYFLTRLSRTPERKFWYNLGGFVIAGTLCAYNHHFSMLQALLLGLAGLFLMPRKRLIHYLGAGVVIVLLYLPHISITLYQLGIGGVEGWLAKPGYDFILKYTGYLFHFSWLFGIVSITAFLAGLFAGEQKKKKTIVAILFLLLFIIPFVTGFVYSIQVSAVLQNSVLIFSFPFLLMGLSAFLREQKRHITVIISGLIIISGSLTLILNRSYYSVFYNTPNEQCPALAEQDQKELGKNKCIVLLSLPDRITKYYHEREGYKFSYIYADSLQTDSLLKILETPGNEFLSYSCISGAAPELVPIIQKYYPYLQKRLSFYGGDYYLFSKTGTEKLGLYSRTILQPFGTEIAGWSSSYNSVNTDSNNIACRFDSLSEWGPGYTIVLNSLIRSSNDFIDISVDYYPLPGFADALIVTELHADSLIDWRSTSFNRFGTGDSVWYTAVHSVKLADLNLSGDTITFKTYVWNNGKASFLIDNFRISVRKGNPVQYWWIEPVKFSE